MTERRRRHGPGWVPQQHGAWAMLAAPLLVGVVAGSPAWVHLPLAVFWFVGYFAFNATSLWLKSRRRPRYLPPVRVYAATAAVLGLVTLAMEPGLVIWVPAFVVPLAVGLWAAAARHERDLVAGLTTAVGSSLMTLVAYDAGAGQVDGRALALTAAQALYFAGTVFYVKSAIRERGNRPFLLLSVGYHIVATAIAAALSWWLSGVFALLTLRALVVPPRGFSPKALGIGEVAATALVTTTSLLVL